MLQAVNTRIVCKRSEEVRQTESGIILQSDNSEQVYAQVLSVGPDVRSIEVGDQLAIDWRNAMQLKHDGDNYYVIDEKSVLAIVR